MQPTHLLQMLIQRQMKHRFAVGSRSLDIPKYQMNSGLCNQSSSGTRRAKRFAMKFTSIHAVSTETKASLPVQPIFL
jgi:hypothetical protein